MSSPIYVVRHAETIFGERGLVNGDPAVANPLTPKGRDQARDLHRKLGPVHIGVAITTEFPRTQETADLILQGRQIERVVVADLNDPRQGDYEGRDFELYAKWMDESGMEDPVPGGGESQLECVTRYARGWRYVVDRALVPVLVVAHAFPISVALTLHEDGPPLLRRDYKRDPGFAELNTLDPGRLAAGLDILDQELRNYRSVRS